MSVLARSCGMYFDLGVPALEEMPRDELVVLVGAQAARIAAQDARLVAADGQITAMARHVADLVEMNEALAAKVARLEYVLSRNSGNSSSPPSKDDGPGKTSQLR